MSSRSRRFIDTVRAWSVALLLVGMVGGASTLIAVPQPVGAVCSEEQRFLTFPAWYNGLLNDSCEEMAPPSEVPGGLQQYIWTIVFNIIEIILQLVGYLSVVFIMYGGFLFLTNSGSPDGMGKARKTIMNAAIGLLISIASVALVNLVARAIV